MNFLKVLIMKSNIQFSIILAISLGIVAAARAQSGDLTGDTVTASGVATTWFASADTAVVGPGPEFAFFQGGDLSLPPFINIDFGADTLTFSVLTGIGFGGGDLGAMTFTFADNTIDNIFLYSDIGVTGNITGQPTFTADSITVDWGYSTFSQLTDGSSIVFDIDSTPNGAPASAPDTGSTLTLLAGAFAGLATFRRRYWLKFN
jgi:hypothetical protein